MRYNKTERIGVGRIQIIVTEQLNWIFREQTTIDTGIDAIIEIVDENYPTGNYIGVQIKTRNFQLSEDRTYFTLYVTEIHKEYWLKHSIPVIVVLYNPTDEKCIWEAVTEKTLKRTNTKWKINIPKRKTFDTKSINILKNLTIKTDKEIVNTISKNEFLRIHMKPKTNDKLLSEFETYMEKQDIKIKQFNKELDSLENLEIDHQLKRHQEISKEALKEFKKFTEYIYSIFSKTSENIAETILYYENSIVNNLSSEPDYTQLNMNISKLKDYEKNLILLVNETNKLMDSFKFKGIDPKAKKILKKQKNKLKRKVIEFDSGRKHCTQLIESVINSVK